MAPSPTGNVHVGSARTALFNLLFARHHGGVFVLRLDDTDLERSRREHELAIYDAFRWLGLDWDEGPERGGDLGPYRQSERLDIYHQQAVLLLRSGAAYRCFCTPDELDAERRQAEREKRPYVYSRRCLKSPPSGRSDFAVRFRVPGGEVAFDDLVRGPMLFDGSLIGDFVIVKTDGYPTYNFASPVDDALMEISHVIRAEEHLPNTPGQVMILRVLGFEPPAFAHLPLILAPDRTKLSKRRHPVMLTQYRGEGYLPEALVNYLALLGWNPGTEQEVFSMPELVRAFSLDRVQKSGAVFDREKLDWLNGHYIRALSVDELAARLSPFLPELDERTVRAAAPALQERMQRLDEARALLAYLWVQDLPPSRLEGDAAERIRPAIDELGKVDWNPADIEAALDRVREAHGYSRNQLFKPIRSAVTGTTVSPPIHYTLALLPKEKALARLKSAVA
jgi:glutamyl-tRNA synthetase